MTVSDDIASLLREYASRYERKEFLDGDPSRFMHLVEGNLNQETMAFLAASISYGSRAQFLPKIEELLTWSEGEPYEWIRSGAYAPHFEGEGCFYRLYTKQDYKSFLDTYRHLMSEYVCLGDCLSLHTNIVTALDAIKFLCERFRGRSGGVIPQDATSPCKRLAMFLRWMVRDNSPVDIGLWRDIIRRESLIMPLDTHVLTEAVRLGLLRSRTASMASAIKLTQVLAEIFPGDPLKGDFALFGYGVNKEPATGSGKP